MTPTPHPAEESRRVPLAAGLAVVSVVCALAVLGLRTLRPGGMDVPPYDPADFVLATVWPVTGALVVRARPRNPVGWLLLVTAMTGPYQLLAFYAAWSGGGGALGTFAAWVAIWGFAPYFFVPPLLPHFFPDGRLPSPRWRPVVRVVLAIAVITTLARMFGAVTADLAPAVTNPLGIEQAPWLRYVTQVGSATLFFVGLPLAAASLAVRMRRAGELERVQLMWLFLGVLALVAAFVAPVDEALAIGLLGPPLGIGVAMLRHGLFDVELTLNRTVVFGLLTAMVVGVYAVVVYGVQVVVPGSAWGVALVAAAALGAAAARDRVQALVDRWLFGHRHNPYAVVSHVGRHVAAATEPVQALQGLVDGLRDALRLPYVAFTGSGIAAVSGAPRHGSRVVPVSALGEPVGELHVGLRTTGERWSAHESAAIDEIAARAGTLAYAAGLVADVALSRERIVTAREEERRRLRADLHDGVAPALAGTALQMESLARRLQAGHHEELAARTLQLRDGLRATVTELRALVHGLRPPVLDQLGLAGALRQLVAGHDRPVCGADVGELGDPSAAVEVAAYGIAAEACANALRHSSASRLTLTARLEGGALVIEVADNGVGLPSRLRPGVGMVSMRERAAEVGGRLEIVPTAGGGTTVRAILPGED